MGSWWSKFKTAEPLEPDLGTAATRGKAVSWQNNYPTQVQTQAAFVPTEPHAVVNQQGYLAKAPPSERDSQAMGNCPECGSSNYFSRTLGVMRGPTPAPLCAECGYNGGLFTQTGTMLNGAGVISGGPTHQAPSDNPTGANRVDWSHPIRMPGRRA